MIGVSSPNTRGGEREMPYSDTRDVSSKLIDCFWFRQLSPLLKCPSEEHAHDYTQRAALYK